MRLKNIRRVGLISSAMVLMTALELSAQVVREGSLPLHRSQTDGAVGNVYIYVGGDLPALTHLTSFQYLFDIYKSGAATGYITPLLFQREFDEIYTVYRVVAIGKGFEVSLHALPASIPFEIVTGISTTPNGDFTFGFINALVDSNGIPFAQSAGTIDYDHPNDGGSGVGGLSTTNDWVAINPTPPPSVTLNATFGLSGSHATYFFYGDGYRTYSAQVLGDTSLP